MPLDIKTGIIVTGRDEGASATLDKVSTKTKIATVSFDGLRKGVKSAPESFSKSAAALNLFNNSMSASGGKAAEMASKISGVVSIIAMGGPLAIGIGAVTAAVAAGSYVWNTYSLATDRCDDSFAKLRVSMEKVRAGFEDQRAEVERLRDEINHWGETSDQRSLREKKNALESREAMLQKTNATIAALKRETSENEKLAASIARGRRVVTAAEKAQYEAVSASVAEGRRRIASLEYESQVIAEKVSLDKQLVSATILHTQMQNADTAAADRRTQSRERLNKKLQEQKKIEEDSRRRTEQILALEKKTEEQKTAILEEQSRYRLEMRVKESNEQIELQERASKKAIQIEKNRNEAILSSMEGSASNMSSSIANIYAELIMGEKDLNEASKEIGKSMLNNTIEIVKGIVQARAVEAAAKAAATNAGAFPGPVGIAVAAGAATTMLALVQALVEKMAFGGYPRGGTPGRDSTLALLNPKEYVAPSDEQAGLKRFMKRALGADDRTTQRAASVIAGSGRSAGGPGQISLTLNQPVMFPDRQIGLKAGQKFAKHVERLKKLGHWR